MQENKEKNQDKAHEEILNLLLDSGLTLQQAISVLWKAQRKIQQLRISKRSEQN